MLCKGINKDHFNIYHVKFAPGISIKLIQCLLYSHYTELTMPLPLMAHEALSNQYWAREYAELIAHLSPIQFGKETIIHIHTINLINIATSLKQIYGCKIVSHIHCIPWKYFYSGETAKFNYLYRRLITKRREENIFNKKFMLPDEQNIAQKSDAIICLTKSAIQYFTRYLHANPAKLHYIPNGIEDSNRHYRNLIKTRQANTGKKRLLYVGKVSEEKGIPFLLEAFSLICQQESNIQLIIAGEEEKSMSSLLEEKYSQLDIVRKGMLNYSQLCSLYCSCHIGVLPSLFEQCSYSALEMMMFGLPVIHSDIAEMRDIFGGNNNVHTNFNPMDGLTIDTEDLANSIIHLVYDKTLQIQNGIHNRLRYLKYFQSNNMIKEITNVYNRI